MTLLARGLDRSRGGVRGVLAGLERERLAYGWFHTYSSPTTSFLTVKVYRLQTEEEQRTGHLDRTAQARVARGCRAIVEESAARQLYLNRLMRQLGRRGEIAGQCGPGDPGDAGLSCENDEPRSPALSQLSRPAGEDGGG